MSNTRAEITLEWESGLTEEAIESQLRDQFGDGWESVEIDVTKQ